MKAPIIPAHEERITSADVSALLFEIVFFYSALQWISRYGLKTLGLASEELITRLPLRSRHGYKHVTAKVTCSTYTPPINGGLNEYARNTVVSCPKYNLMLSLTLSHYLSPSTIVTSPSLSPSSLCQGDVVMLSLSPHQLRVSAHLIRAVRERYRARLKWLTTGESTAYVVDDCIHEICCYCHAGSRKLFGAILEKKVYFCNKCHIAQCTNVMDFDMTRV